MAARHGELAVAEASSDPKAVARFIDKIQGNPEEGPWLAIANRLRRQFEVEWESLSEINSRYDPQYRRPPMSEPQHVKILDVAHQYDNEVKLRVPNKTLPMCSGYVGQEGWGKAARFTGFELLAFAVINPILEAHSRRQFPRAEHLGDVQKLLDSRHVGEYFAATFSPHCTVFP